MPAISRDLRDLAKTGHGCTTVIGCKATQFSVLANGSAVLRPGDPLLPHTIPVCCPLRCEGHPAVINSGSRTVFAEGRPVARLGDSADLGAMIMGSQNVFAG
jgi:uncharacterized Zn-binding protein involved in type VI secretion